MDDSQKGTAASPPPQYHAPPPDLEARVRVVQLMLEAFRPERYAYLSLCVIACAVLIWSSIRLFASGQTTTAIALFGSSGVMTVTLGLMLRMWNRAWKLVEGGAR